MNKMRIRKLNRGGRKRVGTERRRWQRRVNNLVYPSTVMVMMLMRWVGPLWSSRVQPRTKRIAGIPICGLSVCSVTAVQHNTRCSTLRRTNNELNCYPTNIASNGEEFIISLRQKMKIEGLPSSPTPFLYRQSVHSIISLTSLHWICIWLLNNYTLAGSVVQQCNEEGITLGNAMKQPQNIVLWFLSTSWDPMQNNVIVCQTIDSILYSSLWLCGWMDVEQNNLPRKLYNVLNENGLSHIFIFLRSPPQRGECWLEFFYKPRAADLFSLAQNLTNQLLFESVGTLRKWSLGWSWKCIYVIIFRWRKY